MMKTPRYGCYHASGIVVIELLLFVCGLLMPPLQAADTLPFIPGELQRQVYTNVPGPTIGDLLNSPKFPDHPDLVSAVNAFETPSNCGDQYGERLTGFIVPPETGDYVFYLASDDQGVLFLSPDANPTNKVQIAMEYGWGAPRNWTGTGPGRTNSANISAPIRLEAGRRYYVEALHKEAAGGDCFGVAWQLPGEPPPVNGSPAISGKYLGREIAGLPNLSFRLAFFSGSGPSTGGSVFFRDYTVAGPQPGAALLPAMRVVPDAGGRFYYANKSQSVLEVDSQTGAAEEMALGAGVPELSWPMGMTFDSARNRVLLVSLGGEGFLYSYAPSNRSWSVLASMENRDLDSLVYHAGQDALYGFEVYRVGYGNPRLFRFDANGLQQGEIPLPALPFDVGVSSYQSELVSAGDYLFLLIGPDPNFSTYPPTTQESRMYLIDPRSSQVWLTYRQLITPPNQPPSVAIHAPAEEASIDAEVPILLKAHVADADGAVVAVEFFANSQSLGFGTASADGASFVLAWANPQPGSVTLTAKATDDENSSTFSAPVHLTVRVLPTPGSPAPGNQEKPAVASNGSLYLVVWADSRGTNGWDIYGARVTPTGRVLDPDGIRICSLPEVQADPAVASDGHDFLVAWNDTRDSSPGNYDIYGARVTAEGCVIETNGFPICQAPYAQFYPSIAFNGTNYLLAWYDYRNSDSTRTRDDIYGARVSPQGVVLDPNGVAICTADDMQWAPGVTSWGGEFFVAWDDSILGLSGARVTGAGAVVPPNGALISSHFSGYPIRVAANPTGYLVVWTDGRDYEASGYNIYARRLSFDGTPLDAADLVLCNAFGMQVGPAVTAWGNEFLAVWLDDRLGYSSTRVYAARVGAGGLLDPEGIQVGLSPSSSSMNLPAATSLNGQYLVVWVGSNSGPYGNTDIWGARLSATGTLLDTNSLLLSTVAPQVPVITWPTPAPITYGTALSASQLSASANVAGHFVYNPPLGTRLNAGAGQALSVTFAPADTTNYTVVTARQTLDVQPAALTITADNKTKNQGQPNPPLTATYSGFVAGDNPASLDTPVSLTTTATASSPAGTYPIVAIGANDPNYTITHVNGVLTVVVPPDPGNSGDQKMPAVASSDSLYLIAWADRRNGQTNDWDIYAARVTPEGRVLDPGGIAVCTWPLLQQRPRVASDGKDFLVVWEDARPVVETVIPGVTNFAIYGARISADGRLLEPNRITISQASGSQSEPSVAWNGATYLVTWMDSRAGTATQQDLGVYGARVSQSGTVLDPGGRAICTAPGQQSWPKVSAWNGDFFVAWSDLGQTPSGIYGTRVTSGGEVVHSNGLQLASAFAGLMPSLAANPFGYLMLWANNPFSGRIGCDVHAMRLAPTGESVLADFGVLRQTTSFLTVADGAASSNEWLAVWMDDRFGANGVKVWGTRIGPAGVLNSNGIEIATMAAPRFWNAPAVASLRGDYLVAWVGPQAGDATLTDIYATRVSHDGLVLDPNGILIDTPTPPPLTITVPPFSQTRFTGQSASFVVEAEGSSPVSYQWLFNGSPLPGANGPTLAKAALQLSNAGPYSVVVANASGSITSAPARLTVLPAPGGPGSLDVTFDLTAGDQVVGPAFSPGMVKRLALQPDGKLLVGGMFVGADGKARNNIARFWPSGRLDEGFSPGYGTDGYVDDIAVQPDGRVLIVGAFSSVNGQPRPGIARLYPDGSVDPNFQPSVGGYPPVCLALQSDGKILIGGSFSNVCGVARPALARLNADGTLDLGFDASSVMTSRDQPGISTLLVQSDGKILVGGQFDAAYDRPLARLNPDGSRDASFVVPQIRESGTVGWLYSLDLNAAGQILIGGRFLTVNGVRREGIVRLATNGAVDETFNPGPLTSSQGVTKVLMQADGKVLIGGTFLGVNGTIRRGLARLLANGAVDTAFDPASAVYANTTPWVSDLVLNPEGRLFVASGSYGEWCRSPYPLCRLNSTGAADNSFVNPVILRAGAFTKVAVQADGKVVGLLPENSILNGQPFGPIARLRADGTLDPTFSCPVVAGRATCVQIQPDGKILVGGNHFLLSDDSVFLGLIRLNPDGSLDSSFQTEEGDYGLTIYTVALQSDGRILVNGVFDTIRGVNRSFVARLNSNGSADESFRLDAQLNPNLVEFEPPINCLAVQYDGKILVSGWFDDAVPKLVRLNADGSLDRELLTPPQAGMVEQIIIQPDGKLLLSGRFDFSGDGRWQTLVRLQADGSFDTAFSSYFNWASSITLQPDGKILMTVVGETVSLIRYNANGSVDTTFITDIKNGLGTPSLMSTVLQPDGQVLVVGMFSSVNGIAWSGLVRLNNDVVVPSSFVARQLPGQHGSPGSTVSLVAQPSATTAVYALQDQPPAGWVIRNISHNGVFDAATGKVKFGPFFDNEARTLTYDAFPPLGFVGMGLFAGVASADGVNCPISGDDRWLITAPHPADSNPTDWTMRLEKMTAYAAAWRTGGVWRLPPNPISVDYVTRAAALWRGGESYTLNCEAGAAPLCWVNTQPAPKPLGLDPATRVSSLRCLPKGYLPGEPIDVTVEIAAPVGTLAYALQESFPAGWRVANISHGGVLDAPHRQIKWGPFCDSTARSLHYQMIPPADAAGSVSLAGTASFDGSVEVVTGPTAIHSTSRLTWGPKPDGSGWTLRLRGDLGARYTVETSVDLVRWTPVTTITNSEGTAEIPTPITTQSPQQYYRARLIE